MRLIIFLQSYLHEIQIKNKLSNKKKSKQVLMAFFCIINIGWNEIRRITYNLGIYKRCLNIFFLSQRNTHIMKYFWTVYKFM